MISRNIKYKIQNANYKEVDTISRTMSIVSLCHIFLLLLWFPMVWMMIETLHSFSNYGWGIVHEYDLPNRDNSIRSWFLFLIVFYVGVMCVTFYQYWLHHHCNELKENKWVIFVPSIIPLAFPWSLYYVISNGYLSMFWYYIKTNRLEQKQISHTQVWKWMTMQTKWNKLIRNTLLCYLTFIILTIGFIFINIQGPSTKTNNIDDFFIFNTMSFFTQQNNIMCWVFIIFFMLFHHKVVFKDNLLQIYVCSYISVVGFVALVMIGPYVSYQDHGSDFFLPYNMTKFFWLHLVDQVFFIWFTINTFAQSYSFTRMSYKKYMFEGSFYPIFYGIYLYTVPFFAYFSVYGFLTNLNPWMLKEDGTHAGNPWWIFGAFGIAAIIWFFLWFYRWLNERICRNQLKYSYSENV